MTSLHNINLRCLQILLFSFLALSGLKLFEFTLKYSRLYFGILHIFAQHAFRNTEVVLCTEILCVSVYLCVCVYSSSRKDVPRVAQRYGTIAAHTRRRASVLVFVMFCMHMHSFASLIRRTPPPTFSDTAVTNRHSDTTIFQPRAHWVRISWTIRSEKSFGNVPRWESNPRLPACKASTLTTRPGSPLRPLTFYRFS